MKRTWREAKEHKYSGAKEAFNQLIVDADLYNGHTEVTNYGFKIFVDSTLGVSNDLEVLYSPKSTEWVISYSVYHDSIYDDPELHFIDVNSMNLNEEPDFDYYDIAIPTQKRGKGFNNLIDTLFIDFIGEYEELEYAFEKIDLNDREKYYI